MKKIISKKQLREFGIIIALFFPFFIGWLIPLLSGHLFKFWTFYVSVPFIILGLTKPQLLIFPYNLWMKLGYILGWINSRIILGLVFFIVLLPMAILMRIFGYDPLNTKKINKTSYRKSNENYKVDLTRIF